MWLESPPGPRPYETAGSPAHWHCLAPSAVCSKLTAETDGHRTIIREQHDTSSEVGRWMAQTIQDAYRIENLLGAQPSTRITADDIKAMLTSITRSLARADLDIKAAAYAKLGITVTYHADGRALLESRPLIGGVGEDGVGGGTSTLTPPPLGTGRYAVAA